jgi:serine/threonine-protein kinase
MNDEAAQAAALPGGMSAGSRVAGYRLEEQIGQGGMAVVFRARDERLGRQVALKVLAPALATDESFRRRFIRESRSAAAVDHPHIIPVFDAGKRMGCCSWPCGTCLAVTPGHWCAGAARCRRRERQ